MTVLSRSSTSIRVDVRVRAFDERQLLQRIRAEFEEMPGLSLTLAQAQRLWGLDRATCERLCGRLVEDGYLRQTSHGAYVLGERAWIGRHAH